jgi:phosphopantetheinyl transferase (holo-ACP synthase)
MRPRPFPIPISVGTDIVSIKRILRILSLPGSREDGGPSASPQGKKFTYGKRFAHKILCPEERYQARKHLAALDDLKLVERQHGEEELAYRERVTSLLKEGEVHLGRVPANTRAAAQFFAGRWVLFFLLQFLCLFCVAAEG